MKKLDEAEEAVDLKATVTLSGEALAALLEEVKNARAVSREPSPVDPEPTVEPEPALPAVAAEPLPQPKPRFSWTRFR